jgi:HK97 gp10 family phage protein
MIDIKFNFNLWYPRNLKSEFDGSASSAAEQAAEYVAQQARQYAPVDTEELRKSIIVVPSMNRMVWNVLVGVPYAGYVEYGTLHEYPGGTLWIPPNPFFRKAMADGRKRFPEILRQSMMTTPHQLAQGMKLGTTVRVAA